MRGLAVWMLVSTILVSGCGDSSTESLGTYEPTLYVEGYLIAGNAIDSLFVGTTVPLFEAYSRELSAIVDADVAVEVDGTIHLLMPLAGRPGQYHLPSLLIEAGKTYKLSVTVEGVTATAQTTVPSPPIMQAESANLVLNETPFTATWIGETEVGYVTSRKTLNLAGSIPLELQFGGGRGGFGGGFGGGFAGADTAAFAARRDSLAQLDQWRFVRNQSTTLNWQQFTHYGTYSFLVYSIDKNYGDFLVSNQQDPQILDEPRFHIEGGIGIFASMAPDSVAFTIR